VFSMFGDSPKPFANVFCLNMVAMGGKGNVFPHPSTRPASNSSDDKLGFFPGNRRSITNPTAKCSMMSSTKHSLPQPNRGLIKMQSSE
jgi:hypothetical protein